MFTDSIDKIMDSMHYLWTFKLELSVVRNLDYFIPLTTRNQEPPLPEVPDLPEEEAPPRPPSPEFPEPPQIPPLPEDEEEEFPEEEDTQHNEAMMQAARELHDEVRHWESQVFWRSFMNCIESVYSSYSPSRCLMAL